MFESASLGAWMRLALAFLAILIARRLLFGRHSRESRREQAERRQSARKKTKELESDSDFSDEPSAPVVDENADPAAALESLPRVIFQHTVLEEDEMAERALSFYTLMNKRRTVREFSTRDVPLSVVENIVRTAGTAPSGAHTEPWTYVVVRDQETKFAIRQIVEREEEINYDRRMGNAWVRDVTKLATNHEKEYLEEAPYLIVAFEQTSGRNADGSKKLHYYSRLSCAISCGLLVAAIHNAGETLSNENECIFLVSFCHSCRF